MPLCAEGADGGEEERRGEVAVTGNLKIFLLQLRVFTREEGCQEGVKARNQS